MVPGQLHIKKINLETVIRFSLDKSIREINNDGSVTCEPDNNSGDVVVSIGAGGGIQVTGTVTDPSVSQISGAIGIPAVAWHVENELNCTRVMNIFKVQVNGTNCRISAPVYPPQGATITSFTCFVFGNTTGIENIELIGRPSDSTNGYFVIAATPATDGTQSNQTLSTSSITNPLVNGITTEYYLRSSILDSTGLLQIYNCHIHYSF